MHTVGVYFDGTDTKSFCFEAQLMIFSTEFWQNFSAKNKKLVIFVIRSLRLCTLMPYYLQPIRRLELFSVSVRGQGCR